MCFFVFFENLVLINKGSDNITNKIKTIIGVILLLVGTGIINYELITVGSEVKNSEKIVNDFVIVNDSTTDSDKIIDSNKTDVNEKDKNSNTEINWSKLLKTNKDVVAWIEIPNTNINYPVLKGKSNDTYLRTNVYKNHSFSGSIFVSEDNDKPFDDFNTIIYGHNLENGQMFSKLKKYKSQDFYQKHSIIYIHLPNGSTEEYKIVSFHEVNDADNDVYNLNCKDYSDYKQGVNKNNKLRSVYSFDDSSVKKVITLSTCTNRGTNKRYVLHAVKL